jgi:hypothetical protein
MKIFAGIYTENWHTNFTLVCINPPQSQIHMNLKSQNMMLKLKAPMLYICELLNSNFDREAEYSDPCFMPLHQSFQLHALVVN